MDKRSTLILDPVDGVLVRNETVIPTPIKQNTVQGTVDSFGALSLAFGECVREIQEMSDRVNGPRPRPTIDEKELAPPNSLLNSVRSKRDELQKLADLLKREIKGLRDGLWGSEQEMR